MVKKKQKEPVKPVLPKEPVKEQEGFIRVDGDRIILKLGEQTFNLKKDNWDIALDEHEARKKQSGVLSHGYKTKVVEYPEWDTPEFFCKFHVIFQHFGHLVATARFLKVNEEELRIWLGPRSNQPVWWRNPAGDVQLRLLMEKYTKALFPEDNVEPEPPLSFDFNKVVNTMVKNPLISPREIAKRLKVDEKDFLTWYARCVNDLSEAAQKRSQDGQERLRTVPDTRSNKIYFV